jgi:hypothetical protein
LALNFKKLNTFFKNLEILICFTIYQISKLGIFSIDENMCIVVQPRIFNLLVPLMTIKEKKNHDLPNS